MRKTHKAIFRFGSIRPPTTTNIAAENQGPRFPDIIKISYNLIRRETPLRRLVVFSEHLFCCERCRSIILQCINKHHPINYAPNCSVNILSGIYWSLPGQEKPTPVLGPFIFSLNNVCFSYVYIENIYTTCFYHRNIDCGNSTAVSQVPHIYNLILSRTRVLQPEFILVL